MKLRKAVNIGILIGDLFLIASCEILNSPLPFGVTGSWHGELVIQPENDSAEPLTVGLDFSLTQTTSLGAISGHMNIVMPSFYLSLSKTRVGEKRNCNFYRHGNGRKLAGFAGIYLPVYWHKNCG